jgi:hypothetical protein
MMDMAADFRLAEGLAVGSEWREHAMLKGRLLPDHPDHVQVIVHDGGPQITWNEPEILWVAVTGMDGDLFWGRVLNQPYQLQTVHRDDEIKFVMPAGDVPADLRELAAGRLRIHPPPRTGWLAPVRVTDKYLRERQAWIIHACDRCGLSELFDAPSDVIRVLFPHSPPDAEMSMFTAPCPHCGGSQRVESRKSLPTGGAEPGAAGSNLGRTYLETARLWAENMTAIGRLLGSIEDDASADVALPMLHRAIARHHDLNRKLESYQLSMEDHLKLARKQDNEYLATSSDMTVSRATAQANAAFAKSKTRGKAKDIEAAMKGINLA